MKYIYKYEDSMRQCETLLTENFVKLCNYSICLVQLPSISSSEFAERVKKYEIMKKKLNTAQENIATLKSEYNDLTLHCLKSALSGINFKEKFFNYLARQETLRSKFIETINECKHINSRFDDMLQDCSNQNASKCARSNTADGFDLSSIPKVYVLLPKLDWDYGDSLGTSDSNSLKPNSFSNEHADELYTSAAAASASKSLKVSSSDLNTDVAVKKCNSTTVLETKKLTNLPVSKRCEAPNLRQSLVCKICHLNISTKGNMKRHMFLHEGLEPFECANCDKSFARKENIKSHIFSMHMPYQSRPYKCDTCSKLYLSRSDLKKHRCSTTQRNHSTQVSDRRQFLVCNICRKHFSRPSDLKRHRLIHEGLKPFKCAECGKSFRTKHEMDRHSRRCHLPYHARPYSCNVCGKRCIAQWDLNYHKRLAGHYCSSKLFKTSADVDDRVIVEECASTTVLDAKEVGKSLSSKQKKNSNSSQCFVCNICDRNFSKQAYLERHLISHEGSKPFKCAVCDKSFAKKSGLKQHIILVHINDQRSLDSHYCCAHCKYRCQSKESLVYHIKRHHISNLSLDEFSCTVCGKTFAKMYHRKIHEQTVHVEEKCFCCTNCGKRYKYDSSLAQHLKLRQCKALVAHSSMNDIFSSVTVRFPSNIVLNF